MSSSREKEEKTKNFRFVVTNLEKQQIIKCLFNWFHLMRGFGRIPNLHLNVLLLHSQRTSGNFQFLLLFPVHNQIWTLNMKYSWTIKEWSLTILGKLSFQKSGGAVPAFLWWSNISRLMSGHWYSAHDKVMKKDGRPTSLSLYLPLSTASYLKH